MKLFGLSHFAVMAVTLLLPFIFLWYSRFFPKNRIPEYFLAVAIIGGEIAYISLKIFHGLFDVRYHLPLRFVIWLQPPWFWPYFLIEKYSLSWRFSGDSREHCRPSSLRIYSMIFRIRIFCWRQTMDTGTQTFPGDIDGLPGQMAVVYPVL